MEMAGYRNVSMHFWDDPKVDDEFTPEDKYFYLYLLTNPHTNICGCYEISMKQMERETGYSRDTITRLLARMKNAHGVIDYSAETKEVLIFNWSKYNWTQSDKLKAAVLAVAKYIKYDAFRMYVIKKITNDEPEQKTLFDDPNGEAQEAQDVQKEKIGKYGEYQHVRLTDAQYQKLIADFGERATLYYIKKVDEYCEQSGKRYKNYNLAIRNTFMRNDRNGIMQGQQRMEGNPHGGIGDNLII